MKNTSQANGGAQAPHAAEGTSIKGLVLQEAAAAILAAGRELTESEDMNVREFLRGPVLKMGIALSVMGVTMWIAEVNRDGGRRPGRPAPEARRPERRRGRMRARSDAAAE